MGSLRKSSDRFFGAAPLNTSPTLFSHCRWLSRAMRVDGAGDVAKGPTVGASGGGGGGIPGPPPVPVPPVIVFVPPDVPPKCGSSPMLPVHPTEGGGHLPAIGGGGPSGVIRASQRASTAAPAFPKA